MVFKKQDCILQSCFSLLPGDSLRRMLLNLYHVRCDGLPEKGEVYCFLMVPG